MAETQGLLGTSRSDQAGPVEEVLSETDELAGLSLNPEDEYVWLRNNSQTVVNGVMVQAAPQRSFMEKATGAVLGLCSLEVQRKQEDTQLLDQGPYNMDLEMVQAVYVGPGTAGAIVKIPVPGDKTFMCRVGAGQTCNLGKAFGMMDDEDPKGCWRSLYDCICCVA